MSSQPNKKVVVIDDDPSVQEVTRAYLERDGYLVYVAGTASEGLAIAERVKPGLIVLDLMLPDRSGEEICREIRERSDVPILMLTAKASEDERVAGLALGADDYLTKPFSPRELSARTAALLQRSGRTAAVAEPVAAGVDAIEAGGGLAVVPARHVATLDGRPVPLTPPEVDVLAVLAQDPGKPWERRDLVRAVWGGEFIESDFLIDVHVGNLRRKLRKAGAGSDRIRTVDGAGYALAVG